MKTVKISGNTSFAANEANTTYRLAADRTFDVQGFAITADGSLTGRVIDIDGSIHGSTIGIVIGKSAVAAPITVNIGKHADLSGGGMGMQLYGDDHMVRNAGSISGVDAGIEAHDGMTIINSGKISGHVGVNYWGAGDSSILRNSGIISTTNGDKAI